MRDARQPAEPALTCAELSDWIGRTTQVRDVAALAPLRLLAATLDRDEDELLRVGVVPSLGHWLYFLPTARQSELGADGHPRRGGFLPPVSLPRRMWAGSRLTFHRDLRIGSAITRTSRILDVREKVGRSGPLVFVTLMYEVHDETGLAISETQDLVYRGLSPSGQPQPAVAHAPQNEEFVRTVLPDPVLLFRYSALTFNGHRIHYDRPFATEVEGYAGLIVHGPLIATLLLDNLLRAHPQARIASYEFRAVSPLDDTAGFTVCGRRDGGRASLWARSAAGALAMQAEATLA